MVSPAMIDSLYKYLHPIILSCKDFHKNWPKTLRYGTHEMCSLQMTRHGVVQMLKKIEILQNFLSYIDYSNLIISLMENFQLASGITIPILTNQEIYTKYIFSI